MKATLNHLRTLVGVSQNDFTVLGRYSSQIDAWLEEIVEDFYDALFAYETTASVFSPDERTERKETLRDWLRALTLGADDDEFWQQQWTVGLVHFQRQVKNAYMLGMMSRIQQHLLAMSLEELEYDQALELHRAFKRVTDVVAGLIAEGYLQGYVTAVEEVTGLKGAFLDRMAEAAVGKLRERERTTD